MNLTGFGHGKKRKLSANSEIYRVMFSGLDESINMVQTLAGYVQV
jgi:hypothetical protein